MRGGHGNAGWCKHKWTHVLRYEYGRIGKHGFICPTSRGELATINVGDLDRLIDIPPKGKVATATEKVLLNLVERGYQKLLGAGKVTRPFQITVHECSESAKKKIEEAGGSIELVEGKEKP